MPADPTPADARALVEAVLAEIAGPKECACPWCDNIRLVHEVARALLAALDEREAMVRGGLAANEVLDEVTADRDALLADLPHAVGRCGCKMVNVTPGTGWPRWVYPESHTAAIARLEARMP